MCVHTRFVGVCVRRPQVGCVLGADLQQKKNKRNVKRDLYEYEDGWPCMARVSCSRSTTA
jgi:hypothetical protein